MGLEVQEKIWQVQCGQVMKEAVRDRPLISKGTFLLRKSPQQAEDAGEH